MLVKFFLINDLRSNIALFNKTKHAEPSKRIVIAQKPSDANMLCGVLGALGRRFESCRPDSYINRSQQYHKVSLKNP